MATENYGAVTADTQLQTSHPLPVRESRGFAKGDLPNEAMGRGCLGEAGTFKEEKWN